MSPRALVYSAVVAVILAVPVGALAGNAIVAPTAVSVSSSSNVTCNYTCDYSMGYCYVPIDRLVFTATAGTFPGGAATEAVLLGTSGPNGSATLAWAAPAAPTTATLTCQGAMGTTLRGTAATAPVTVNPVAPPVFVDSFTTLPPASVLVGSVVDVTAMAVDQPGRTLTYSWSVTAGGGSFANPAAASTKWTAPATNGTFRVTVTATNDLGGVATRYVDVNVQLSIFQAKLNVPMSYPRRVAATPDGELLVIDDSKTLFLLTKKGEQRAAITGLGATAVTYGDGVVYVATEKRGILKIDLATGRQIGSIPWSMTLGFTTLALDSPRGLLWGSIGVDAVALRMDGTVAKDVNWTWDLNLPTGRALRSVAAVALDSRDPSPANWILWVAERDGTTGNRLHAFSAANAGDADPSVARSAYLRSMVTYGSAVGQVELPDGLAVGSDGRVYVSDSASVIQVMSSTGTPVGTIGKKGNIDDGSGYILQPRGLAFMANGDLAVANSWFNRVDRFGTGAPLPTCAGDTDCDGLPDAWEKAMFGEGPCPGVPGATLACWLDSRNALADPDGDGLNNPEELRNPTCPALSGSNPMVADTDGDGYADREELLAGFSSCDGSDHSPSLVAGNLGKVLPGLVRLSATSGNAGGCTASWTQVAGPKVTLRDVDTFTPSFIARTAATYRFKVAALCGSATSAAAYSEVEVENVAPLADAGNLVVTAPGRTVSLNARFSSDANGGQLGYAWEQVAGPATTVASRGAGLTVRPMREGFYAYQLTATDGGGAQGATVVGVVAVDSSLPTAVVANPIVGATAPGSVTLVASAIPADATLGWTRINEATGERTLLASSTVDLPAAGRYLFEVTATKGGVTSPPSQVVVLAGPSGVLPSAAAAAPSTGAVNTPITLDGSGSGGIGLAHAWRQLAGPAAGLSGADTAIATAVPFEPGVYVFELTVADAAGAVSAPSTVRIDVAAAGKALPVAAVVVANASPAVNELIVLNGRTSTGANRYHWTQVAGPWVAIDAAAPAPVFQARTPGTYEFELVVDDGKVRSAPAPVTLTVQ